MRTVILIAVLSFVLFPLKAQDKVRGKVIEISTEGKEQPLIGANIYWLGTTIGTTSDANGDFSIITSENSGRLIVSFVGFISDTLQINDNSFAKIILKKESFETGEVEVTARQKSTFVQFKGIENSNIITKRELQKAACCDLSESFETNASIDVSVTDAITGTKQIEMLGLSGIYTYTSMESLPFLRGLISNAGLNFIPGTWIKSINVSKGIGSVVNGFESITGQIDVGLAKPFSPDQEKLNLNIYGNLDKRFEVNMNYRAGLSKKISTVTLLHASTRQHEFDINKDNFMDLPRFSTFNIMQRWKYSSGEGFESQFGFQFVKDKKEGGTLKNLSQNNPLNSYLYTLNQDQFNIHGKIGYVFTDSEYKSFGFQWSLTRYNNESDFGNRLYSGEQKSGYFNFIYQSLFFDKIHKFRTGLSYLYDDYDETFQQIIYMRTEKIPGIFFEYTYLPNELFSFVAGIRSDFHNEYGTMISPRFHLRYSPNEDWIIRAVAGKGFRTSNIFVEYSRVFTSSRRLNIQSNNNFGYGLDQESAWNYGINITHYFLYDWREATLSIDLYRTDFSNIVIADQDTNPGEINFYSVENGAYSNSFQAELNMELFERFDFRLAYRYLDVRNKINNQWQQKSLMSKHRALVNLAYTTEPENETAMAYDFTLQWFGNKRIPSTGSNPDEFKRSSTSPSFILVNAQVTRAFFKDFDVYLGIENMFDFRQDNPIIDPGNPSSGYFDASLIWGPVSGRMIYSGLRYNL